LKKEAERKEQAPATSAGVSSRDVVMNAGKESEQPLVAYTMGEKIGQGAYACVRAGWTKDTGERVAVKVYDKSSLNRESRKRNVQREVHVLAKIRHRHIVGFREWFATDRHIYIVMEYVAGGSLQSLLRKQQNSRFDDASAKRIFAQICDGVGYCHSLRVVHRDIKLENILLDRHGMVKLIDFGFAVAIPVGQKLKVFCGTPSYIAPEIISGQPYGFPGDVWALGIVLYVLLAGRFPFKAATQRELYRRIVRGTYVQLEHAAPEARDLLTVMLTKDQAARPTLDQVMTGPWISPSETSSCSSLTGRDVMSTATTATAQSYVVDGSGTRKLCDPRSLP
jgi:MAP/microtubule affinity-regulating kinase